MKIAVFHELPPGGARKSVNELAVEFKKRHIVDLYYTDSKINNTEKKFYTNTFFYKFVPKLWKGKNWKVRLYKDTIELYKNYKLHKIIAKDIHQRNYDIVFINASKFIESPFLLRFPNKNKVFYCHDPYYRLVYEPENTFPKNINKLNYFYEKVNRYIRKIIDKQNIGRSNYRIANSKIAAKMFNKAYGLVCDVSYLGVDADFYRPAKGKKQIDVLFIGSRDKIDGFDTFEKTLGLIKNKVQIKTVLKEDGWLDNAEMVRLYQKSKIVIALARSEPFGLIPIEAMACGVPVIAVNEGGYRESIITNKTGYLIPRNPKIIAEKIDFLLNDTHEREKLGKNAREESLTNWSWKVKAKELEKLLKLYIDE